MATYGVDIYRRLAERLYGPDYPVWPTGIATGGGATTLDDTVNLSYASGDAQGLNGAYVLDETGYGFSRVTRGAWDVTNSRLTFADILTDFAAGDRYVLTKAHPRSLRGVVNSVLRNLYVPCFFPLSSHIPSSDENDMETSPHITFYANKSANATLAEENTIVYNGAQSLKITAGAATQYTHPGSFSVTEGKQYYASAMFSVTQGDDAELRVVNVQDSNAAIENATGDEPNWTEYAFTLTPPTGCEQVQAWFVATSSGDIIFVDDYILVDTAQRIFSGPSWLKYPSQMIDVVEFPKGTAGPASDNDYRVWERKARSVPWDIKYRDIRGDSPLRLQVPVHASRYYIVAKRPLSEIVDFSTAGKTDTGTSEAGSTTTLQDTGKTWIAGQWEGFTITCTSGTGGGQEATILTNDTDTVTVDTTWTAPGNDTVYSIAGKRTAPVYPVDTIVEHCLFILKNPDRTDKYLAMLRETALGGVVAVAPERVGAV